MIARKFLAAVAAACGGFLGAPAEAAIVHYNVTFDGSIAGTAGTGAFDADTTALAITSFTWDFGSGRTGGLESIVLPDTFLYQAVLFMTGDPSVFGTTNSFGSAGLTDPFPSTSARFCWGLHGPACGGTSDGRVYYDFADTPVTGGQQQLFRGALSYSPATVPEPASMALLGVGLAGLAAVRRRRA